MRDDVRVTQSEPATPLSGRGVLTAVAHCSGRLRIQLGSKGDGMRMSSSHQTGDQGVQQVKSELTDLGWNAIEVPQPGDVGTDLYVQLFDEHRHTLRLVLGIQVRTASSQLQSPVKGDDGGIVGWWCSDHQDHFDYWSTHALPHLIVLRNLEERVSYWVHVTPDVVEPAGEGARIQVPRHQVVSAEQVDDIVKIAASQKAAPLLEGLAISAGIDDLPHSRRLRYALIAPRLATPLRAAGFEDSICAEEAVALIAAGRFRDLMSYADAHDGVPDPEQIGDDATWHWQFASAMWDWAINDSLTRLRLVFESSPDGQSHAASGVLLACALRRNEQLGTSTAVLDSLAQSESLHPVDRGWVLVQRARNKIEVDDVDGAHEDAVEAQGCFAGDHDDITVSALRASAAWSLYYAAWMKRFETGELASDDEEEQQRYQGLLVAFDTTVSWWRSLEVSAALSTEQDESFRYWAQVDPNQDIVTGSSGENALFAAELNADLTAEHSAWRSIAERRGLRLMMHASKGDHEVDALTEGLDILRRCGRQKSLGRAIGHLLRVGPADALARSLCRLPRNGWTSTTVAANFEALKLAGHFLDEQAAGELLLSCARFARGDTADLPRCDLTPLGLTMAALDGAAGLMDAASDSLHSQVARDLAELPPNAELAYSMRIGNVLGQLDWNHVELSDRDRMRELAKRDNARAVAAVLGWFSSNGDTEAREELTHLASTGDLYAISELGDLGELSDAEASNVLDAMTDSAYGVLADARRKRYGGDCAWIAATLVHACATRPRGSAWETTFALLGEPLVDTRTKRALYAAAVESADNLPEEVAQRFVAHCDQIELLMPLYRGDGEIGAMRTHLLQAFGAVSDDAVQAALIAHAGGSHLERCDASRLAHAIGSSGADIVLVMLAGDRDFSVRANAAYWIGRRAAIDESRSLGATALKLAASDATSIQLSLLNGLTSAGARQSTTVSSIAERFQAHPAARVRRRAVALEGLLS